MMFAIIAAILFGLALLLQLIGENIGVLTPAVLTTAGLLFVALHLAGFATAYHRNGNWRRGRRG
jgi:amino acid transporter